MKNLRPSLVFALLISTLSSYVWGQEIERDLRIVPTNTVEITLKFIRIGVDHLQ